MSISALCLGFCQFLFMAAVAVGIAFNALVGKQLAPNATLATLPFLGMMGATAALTLFMPRALAFWGYRGVFVGGAVMGALGCALATYSIGAEAFLLFCLAGVMMGVYQASALYYRFAAADAVEGPHKSTAIAWVLSGGIAAALIGPLIGKNLLHSLPVEYTGAYLAATVLCLLAIPVFAFTPLPQRQAAQASRVAWWPLPKIAVQAILFCSCGYCLMLMVMLASPLAMAGCGFHAGDAASVIQWHLLGMFAPSLITGKWIARWGAPTIAWVGVAILAAGCALALSSEHLWAFHSALFVVGVGWNFMYMGGSTLLTHIPDAPLRSRLQAINEFITFASVTLVSGLTGWVYAQLGWQAILVMGIVLLAALSAVQWQQNKANGNKPVF
ncbi:MAG: hypothetical protein RL497_1799 [Pseudomonadota bacterium]|jgi:MFS family permease